MMFPKTEFHRTRRPGWLSLVLLVMLLAGCVRRTPAGNAPAGLEPSYLPPSPTSVALATSPAPTHTPLHPSPTPTPTSTERGPTPTPDLARYQRQAWAEHSPYGPWQAIFVVAYPEAEDGSLLGDHYHVWVSLLNLENSTSSLLFDEWRPYGLGYTVPQALTWSNDGQSLFLAEAGNADGSGERFFQQLQRLQLQTGALTPLDLPGGPGESISPDGQRLARIDGDRLVLIDIETGGQADLPYDLPGVEWRAEQLFWSPQGDRILFSLRLNPFNPVDEMSSSLFLADLQAGIVRTLIEADRRRFSIRSYPAESAALLADLEAREWWLILPAAAIRSDPPEDISQAGLALQSYFNALQAGRFPDAARWYGGSYEPLLEMNPDIPGDDPAGLFARACTVNGFNCLGLDSLLLERVTETGRYLFQVSFTDPDGNLFIQNPCCGADLELQPPVWLFRYSVQRDDSGRFKVQELPVYSP